MKCYKHNDVDAVGTCTSCGRAICQDCALTVNGKLMCKECTAEKAAHTGSPVVADRKEPVLALLFSLVGGLLTGTLLFSLGQLYNGQVRKFMILTLANLCVGAVAAILYILGSVATLGVGCLCCLPVLAIPLVLYAYELYDAYDTAARMNRGERVPDWLE